MLKEAIRNMLRAIFVDEGVENFGRYYSCYRGLVTDNEDPEFRGRLLVRVPDVHGDETPDDWAVSKGMFAGNGIGLFAIPNKGDVVWISFEGGDPNHPVWEYGWFGDNDVTAVAKNNDLKPTNMVWQSTSGHTIELDDKDGSEVVRIKNKHGFIVELNSNGIFTGQTLTSGQPAVLGDQNETVLSDLQNALQQLTVLLRNAALTDTPAATSLGLAGYVQLGVHLPPLLTTIQQIAGQIPSTKSTRVKLD